MSMCKLQKTSASLKEEKLLLALLRKLDTLGAINQGGQTLRNPHENMIKKQ